jgi:dienelactone hydrolase
MVKEDDLEISDKADGETAPILAGLAEKDVTVPETFGEDLRTWADKYSRKMQQKVYPGMAHGFGARPNGKNEAERAQFTAAFENTCKFIGL